MCLNTEGPRCEGENALCELRSYSLTQRVDGTFVEYYYHQQHGIFIELFYFKAVPSLFTCTPVPSPHLPFYK